MLNIKKLSWMISKYHIYKTLLVINLYLRKYVKKLIYLRDKTSTFFIFLKMLTSVNSVPLQIGQQKKSLQEITKSTN